MKPVSLVPYHLFRFHDQPYVIDIETNTILKLDEPAYAALTWRLDSESPHLILSQLENKFSKATSEAVLQELRWLEERGIFRQPVYTYDEAENLDYIQQLTQKSTNKIELYLAEACNLRCRYCYANSNHALNNGLMPWEIAQKAIDLVIRRAGNAKTIDITFLGGEPLMNKPVLRRVIQYTQELSAKNGKKFHYAMTTNATLLDDEIIGYIKRHNFGLMVSLDGPQEVQDSMRPLANGRGSYELATQNIKRLMQRRHNVTVRCTLTNQYLDRPKLVSFFETFGFTRIAMSRCCSTVDRFGDYDIGHEEMSILNEQDDYFIRRLMDQLEHNEPVRFNPWASALRDIHNPQNRRMRCGVGRGCTTVSIDGSLYPCHRYVGMPDYIIGDVTNGIDRQKYTAYLTRYFATKTRCEQCWAINLCGGYCPWYLSTEAGVLSSPEEWWCQEVRERFEQAIWLYDLLRERYPKYFKKVVGEEETEKMLL